VSSQFAFVVLIAYIGSKYLTVNLMLCLLKAYLDKSDLINAATSMLLMLPLSSLTSSFIPSCSLIFTLSEGMRASSAPSAITITQCPFILALSKIAS
jgi:hypothetical protein